MNNLSAKNSILIVALVLIAGTIWYLQSNKPRHISSSDAPDVVSSLPNQTDAMQESTTAMKADTGTTMAPVMKPIDRTAVLASKKAMYQKAKELVDPTGFINTQPFKLSDFVGKKVILVDFWTYSCINCQRTLPYLEAWNAKYEDKGLVIVGVHTPEFDFEKDIANVTKAAKDLGVTYPVVLDSNMGTWNAYANNYWPHEYLIDIDGYVVHDHIGEGSYDETEKAIQQALKERDTVLGMTDTIDTKISNPTNIISMDSNKVGSSETYFGAARNQYLENGNKYQHGIQTLTFPDVFKTSALYLSGRWDFQDQYAETKDAGAKITYKYDSKNVYFVASSAAGVRLKIFRDGKLLTGAEAGKDVASDGTVTVKDNKLYSLVQGTDYGTHTLFIEVEDSGLDAFTFTFG
jgi:thiol-disulfide isomerase/thioredoxin